MEISSPSAAFTFAIISRISRCFVSFVAFALKSFASFTTAWNALQESAVQSASFSWSFSAITASKSVQSSSPLCASFEMIPIQLNTGSLPDALLIVTRI